MLKSLALLIAVLAVAYYYLQQPNANARVRKPQELKDTYDYVIVGGGTAGSVLAARLSEDPAASVLLLEAGDEEDSHWYSHIPGLCPHLQLTDFDWGYLTEPQKHCCSALINRQARWPRGKGLGGCSTHNYVNYVRCSPKDFDHWGNDLGNAGWSYKDVLPFFKKMENYEIDHLNGQHDQHGYDGPLTIKEGFRTPLGESMHKAILNAGYKFMDDTNGKDPEGFSWVQFNVDKWGRRMSTAKAYLRPAMGRPNLQVVVNAHVTKVLIEPRKPNGLLATGVEYAHGIGMYVAKARKEVIVSGGSINSPQILLLSGIGPKAQLEQFSIPVLVDNPAVGANLEDHIVASLEYKTNASGLTDAHQLAISRYGVFKALAQYYLFGTGPLTKTATEIMGFFRSGLKDTPGPDLQLYFTNPYPFMDNLANFLPETSRRRSITQKEISFLVGAVHLHPTDRGQVRLRSADPFAHPVIDHHYLEDPVDVDILAKGLSMFVELTKSPELKPFDAHYAESGPVPGCEAHKPLSKEYLKCNARNRATTLYHPVGTCRMGKKGQNSVVDTHLRVHGVDGLRVVDASVFPAQVSGNTHAPVVMVAEKAADMIKNDHKH